MAGEDYIGALGLDGARDRWMTALRPYVRRGRSTGDPRHSALLVLDLQRFFLDPGSHAFLPAAPRILPAVRELASLFAGAGSPVIYTRHAVAEGESPGRMGDWWGDVVRDGGSDAELADGCGARHAGHLLRKNRYDAFAGTTLASLLADAGITTVVICGVMTHLCCETTARAAFGRGLHVVVTADGTASTDEALHTGALRALSHGFAQVRSCADVAAWRVGRSCEPSSTVGTPSAAVDPVDLAVVGAGPAGMAAALQATREELTVGLFDGAGPGGLLRNAHRVENYLGVGGIPGEALVSRFKAQLVSHGIPLCRQDVARIVCREQGPFRLEFDGAPHRHAHAVVLATGTRPLHAGIPGEEALAGQVCHGVAELLEGWGSRPAGDVVVIGGGDAALDQAVNLRSRGWQVQVLMRGDKPVGLPLLVRRANAQRIPMVTGSVVMGLDGGDSGLQIQWRKGTETSMLRADRLLVAVGREPRRPAIALESQAGSLEPVDPAMLADWPGILLAGDLRRGRWRQTAMATGDGIQAAMEARRWLAASR